METTGKRRCSEKGRVEQQAWYQQRDNNITITKECTNKDAKQPPEEGKMDGRASIINESRWKKRESDLKVS